jgi:hypothetical protein
MITQERLKELFVYNEYTGYFFWRNPTSNRVKRGDEAGAHDKYGYIVVRVDKVLYKAHRLAWLYVTGSMPSRNLDHINGVKDDNRYANLREVTASENMQNTSHAKGTYWDEARKKWVARIKLNYKNITLGRFDTEAEALAMRKQAEKQYHPFKAVK